MPLLKTPPRVLLAVYLAIIGVAAFLGLYPSMDFIPSRAWVRYMLGVMSFPMILLAIAVLRKKRWAIHAAAGLLFCLGAVLMVCGVRVAMESWSPSERDVALLIFIMTPCVGFTASLWIIAALLETEGVIAYGHGTPK